MKLLLSFQGFFYFVTGLWPLIHMRSFLWLTGEKEDIWLVRTVGGLLALSGLVFLIECRQRKISKSIVVLAASETLFLTAIDLIYTFGGVISSVYLLDAIVEAALWMTWVGLCLKHTILTETTV